MFYVYPQAYDQVDYSSSCEPDCILRRNCFWDCYFGLFYVQDGCDCFGQIVRTGNKRLVGICTGESTQCTPFTYQPHLHWNY